MRFKGKLVLMVICGAFMIVAIGRGFAQEDLVTKTGFDTFVANWLQLFSDKGCSSRQKVCIVQDPQKPDVFVAQYQELGEIVSKEVKPTGINGAPYVGVLKYNVSVYESEGAPSAAEAKKGPFYKTKQVTMTEIFRYSKGRWVGE